MKIGMQTWGSDGDIRPFLALAGGLRASGHEVTMAISSVDNKDYSSLAGTLDVNLIKVNDPLAVSLPDIGKTLLERQFFLEQLATISKHLVDPIAEQMYQASQTLSRDNDIVISHMHTHTVATATEKHDCPRVVIIYCGGGIETKHNPPIGLPNLGKFGNALLWKVGDYLLQKFIYVTNNKIRKRESLPKVKSYHQDLHLSKDLNLVAVSPSLCEAQADWPDNVHVCGFFDVPLKKEVWRAPKDLETFLNAGEPPVYFTFGSMAQFNLEDTTRLFIETVELTGRRAIIQSDWDKLPEMPDSPNIFKIKHIPHESIFPKCSVVVHHGGAGTTHSSLRCGCPSVVVHYCFDQIYWGQELQRLGVGGKPLKRTTVTAQQLADEILSILKTPSMKQKAEDIAKTMKAEEGVQTAVKLIEKQFCKNS